MDKQDKIYYFVQTLIVVIIIVFTILMIWAVNSIDPYTNLTLTY